MACSSVSTRARSSLLSCQYRQEGPVESPDRVGEVVGDWIRSALTRISADDRAAAIVLRVAPRSMTEVEAAGNARRRGAERPRVRDFWPSNAWRPRTCPSLIQRPMTRLRGHGPHDELAWVNSCSSVMRSPQRSTRPERLLVLAFIRWTGIRENSSVRSRGWKVTSNHHHDQEHGTARAELVDLGAESRSPTTRQRHGSMQRRGCSIDRPASRPSHRLQPDVLRIPP